LVAAGTAEAHLVILAIQVPQTPVAVAAEAVTEGLREELVALG
jgi:hypothetical protein